MTRGMNNFDSNFTWSEFFLVFGLIAGIARCSMGSINNSSAGLFCQIHMTTYKVCMKMSFKDVFDYCAGFFSSGHIGFSLSQGIYDCYFAIGFYIIGALS